jgi:hypothetical protein
MKGTKEGTKSNPKRRWPSDPEQNTAAAAIHHIIKELGYHRLKKGD